MVYVSDYVVKANTPFVAYFNDSKSIDVDSWVIMINTEPTANGGRYWRYLYVDACSGELVNESLEWCFPETGFTSEEIGFQGVDDSCDIVQPETKSLSESSVVSNNWAVIINGGFIGPLSSCRNITIATACKADQNSYSLNDLKFDSFLYHWTAAAAGKTPYDNIVNPEQNGYDGISMEEIFKYAKQMDRKEEIPQYCSVSESMGDSYGLAGTKLMQPELVGDSDISTSNVGTVSVDKLPALSYSIEWEAPTNVTLHPQAQNYVKLEHDCPKAMSKSSVVAKLTTSFKTYTLSHEVTLWRPGQHFTDDLIQGNLESEYFSLPFGSNKIENYEWTLIDGCEILYEPTYFVDFRYDGEIPEDYYISVKFKNPFGEPTTIVRHFQ